MTADASGNGNLGTITGATWTTAGRHGNALSFNGSEPHREGRGRGVAEPEHRR